MARIQEEQMEALARMREAQSESRSQWEEERRAEERAVREQYESQRPGSHIILGQRFVAGAQFTPLNPELAEYFQADEGVLVTEVLEGTPADEAGLQAGDVIVRVGSEPVTSLEDLRFALGYLDRPLRLQVIRQGSPVEIVFHR
jgi:C-terminal processing protease CtpA/Prc